MCLNDTLTIFHSKMKVTWTLFFSLCQDYKTSQFKPPEWNAVKSDLVKTLNIEMCDAFNADFNIIVAKYKKMKNSQNSKWSSYRNNTSTTMNEVIFDTDNYNSCAQEDPPPPTLPPTLSLTHSPFLSLQNYSTQTESPVMLDAATITGLCCNMCEYRTDRHYNFERHMRRQHERNLF